MKQGITEYLVQEHQELSHLLNALQEQLFVLPLARDFRKTAESLNGITREVAEALHAHVAEEEQVLYPALEGHVGGLTATLDRMRNEHDAGEKTEKAFHQCIQKLLQNGRNRKEVMQCGRQYILWFRNHLMQENGRLLPMVERGLDPDTQKAVRVAMEELSPESSARVAEGSPETARA
jgi:hemerythrin-like domain-containing protein